MHSPQRDDIDLDIVLHAILSGVNYRDLYNISLTEYMLLDRINNQQIDIHDKTWLHMSSGCHHALGHLCSGLSKDFKATYRLIEVLGNQIELWGNFFRLEPKLAQNCFVYAVTKCPQDVSSFMYNYDKLKNNYMCVYSNFWDLPFENESMDYVSYLEVCSWQFYMDKDMIFNVIEEPNDMIRMFAKKEFDEAIRCLKVGGRLYSSVSSKGFPKYRWDSVRNKSYVDYEFWIWQEWLDYANKHLTLIEELPEWSVWEKNERFNM